MFNSLSKTQPLLPLPPPISIHDNPPPLLSSDTHLTSSIKASMTEMSAEPSEKPLLTSPEVSMLEEGEEVGRGSRGLEGVLRHMRGQSLGAMYQHDELYG